MTKLILIKEPKIIHITQPILYCISVTGIQSVINMKQIVIIIMKISFINSSWFLNFEFNGA